MWAFGRVPLAISARCYHARAHGLAKDSCQFVCEKDADGLGVDTLDGAQFLAVNGVQTLSFSYANLIHEVGDLVADGVASLRLSPHSCDMVAVAETFRGVIDGRLDGEEGLARLEGLGVGAPFSNGFLHGVAGATQMPQLGGSA